MTFPWRTLPILSILSGRFSRKEDANSYLSKSNTQAIINGCSEPNTAAKLCAVYRGGGKSDWFLPSKDELDSMKKNLKAKDIGDFAGDVYWSSSEYNSFSALYQFFLTGYQRNFSKNSNVRVRAARAF